MRESAVEKALCEEIKKMGGVAYKFTSPNRRSVPDRLVLLPKGRVFFVECKATGEKPTPAQSREHERLRALGFDVFVVDSLERKYLIESFEMTPEERIDNVLDSILKASGSALKHYTMQKRLDVMRDAMRKVMSDSYIAGPNDTFEALKNADRNSV